MQESELFFPGYEFFFLNTTFSKIKLLEFKNFLNITDIYCIFLKSWTKFELVSWIKTFAKWISNFVITNFVCVIYVPGAFL
jgi:hypothetical protein